MFWKWVPDHWGSKRKWTPSIGWLQGRHLRGAGGPSPPQGKRKKEKKKEKKEKREKKREKKKERKKGTMNNVKLIHIKCCFFFQFFNSPVALKNTKKFWPPKKKLKWRPWLTLWLLGTTSRFFPSERSDLTGTCRCNNSDKYVGWSFSGTLNAIKLLI